MSTGNALSYRACELYLNRRKRKRDTALGHGSVTVVRHYVRLWWPALPWPADWRFACGIGRPPACPSLPVCLVTTEPPPSCCNLTLLLLLPPARVAASSQSLPVSGHPVVAVPCRPGAAKGRRRSCHPLPPRYRQRPPALLPSAAAPVPPTAAAPYLPWQTQRTAMRWPRGSPPFPPRWRRRSPLVHRQGQVRSLPAGSSASPMASCSCAHGTVIGKTAASRVARWGGEPWRHAFRALWQTPPPRRVRAALPWWARRCQWRPGRRLGAWRPPPTAMRPRVTRPFMMVVGVSPAPVAAAAPECARRRPATPFNGMRRISQRISARLTARRG